MNNPKIADSHPDNIINSKIITPNIIVVMPQLFLINY